MPSTRIPHWAEQQIDQADAALLEQWLEKLLDADSLEDVLIVAANIINSPKRKSGNPREHAQYVSDNVRRTDY